MYIGTFSIVHNEDVLFNWDIMSAEFPEESLYSRVRVRVGGWCAVGIGIDTKVRGLETHHVSA